MLCRVTHSADRAFEFAMPSVVGAASANDGYGTPKIWQLAGDAKLGRRVGEIVQGSRIVRTIRSH